MFIGKAISIFNTDEIIDKKEITDRRVSYVRMSIRNIGRERLAFNSPGNNLFPLVSLQKEEKKKKLISSEFSF